jgi:uncharacterized Zn finger protein
MAMSTCPKCPNSSFELVENTPRHSEFKLSFIQCSSCGAVVGVLDYYNIGQLIHDLAKKLRVNID